MNIIQRNTVQGEGDFVRFALFNGFAKAAARQVKEVGQKIHMLDAPDPVSMDLAEFKLVEATVEKILTDDEDQPILALMKVSDEDKRGLWL
jgi:hypothetical protein